ncbi:hypothetical protein ACQ4PT_014538 [Festuca glaucescens]
MMMMMSPNAAAELDIARGRWGLGWFVPARAGDLDLGAMATCQSVSEWLLCGIRIWEMGTSSSVLDDIRRRFLNLLSFARAIKRREGFIKMVLWVFGYGSLIWNPGFDFDDKILGFITGYKRTFNLGMLLLPGHDPDLSSAAVLWGIAYCVNGGLEKERKAMQYLERRECEYDQKISVDFYKDGNSLEPAVTGVLV